MSTPAMPSPSEVVADGIDRTLMSLSERAGIAFLELHGFWLHDDDFVNEVFIVSKVDRRWGLSLDHEEAAEFLRGRAPWSEEWAVLGLALSLAGVAGALSIGECIQFLSPELVAAFHSSIDAVAEDTSGPQHSF